jgi:hypothetical protein
MKEQIFETLPPQDKLAIQLDMLKYENSFLRKQIELLNNEITKLRNINSGHQTKLELQQEFIDKLTANSINN